MTTMPDETPDYERAFKILSADLDAVRKLEHWGAGLWMTGIAALISQTAGKTGWCLWLTPAVAGIVAALFLRRVNFYTHALGRQLWWHFAHAQYRRVKHSKKVDGQLGKWLAFTPMVLGVLASLCLVVVARPGCLELLIGLGVFTFLIGVFCWQYWRLEDKRKKLWDDLEGPPLADN